MDAIISIVSIMVIATVTVILLYQNASVRDDVAASMQSVVDQVNDSSYYGYQYDKRQEENIKNLDQNINVITKDIRNIVEDIKNVKSQTPTIKDLAKKVETTNLTASNLTTGTFKLGQKFSLLGDGNDEWLKLLNSNASDMEGGFAANKFFAKTGSTFKGSNIADDMTINNTLKVKGGTSKYNPSQLPTIFYGPAGVNSIRGDTEIRGDTNNIGDMRVGNTLNVNNGINTFRSDLGPLLKNTTDTGVEFGVMAAEGSAYQIYNSAGQGSIQLGFGKDKSFEPTVELRKRSATIGAGSNNLSLSQTTADDFLIKSFADKNIVMQSGSREPMVYNGSLGIGGAPQNGARLDVYGNIISRGTDFVLGGSRALVKGAGGDLVLNYESDFPGGISSHSDLSIMGDKCIEIGKDVKQKDANAGKVCYQKWSDSLDIVGAGGTGAERKVKLWDNVEAAGIQASKLCLGKTCINEDDLNKLIKADGNFCLGNTCLQEADMLNVKNMGNQINTMRINMGPKWTLQPEGPDSAFFTIRDNTGDGDKRFAFSSNKYVTF